MFKGDGTSMKTKNVLITGGTSGIGKATAFAFGREGANVIIASRSEENGLMVEKELLNKGYMAKWIYVDVSNAEDIKALFSAIEAQNLKLDYAFNNAVDEGMPNWLHELDETQWEKTIHGVLTSVFLCMKYELINMLANGSGVIVNNASVDGLKGFAFHPSYSAAKHGVVGLTKSAALQYSKRNIRINAICPGAVNTPPMQYVMANDAQLKQDILAHHPIGRIAEPEEIAEIVLWLCSDKASFIVGAAIPVDGGYTI